MVGKSGTPTHRVETNGGATLANVLGAPSTSH